MTASRIMLGTQENLSDARCILEGAIRSASPYKLMRGRLILDGRHGNALKPFCRPVINIANRTTKKLDTGKEIEVSIPEYVHSIVIQTSTAPFEGDNRPEALQRAESLALYKGDREAIESVMSRFEVRMTEAPAQDDAAMVKALTRPTLQQRLKAKRLSARQTVAEPATDA